MVPATCVYVVFGEGGRCELLPVGGSPLSPRTGARLGPPTSVALSVTREGRDRLRRFLLRPFLLATASFLDLVWPVRRDGRTEVERVADALHEIGMLRCYDARQLTPSDLRRLLVASSRRRDTTAPRFV